MYCIQFLLVFFITHSLAFNEGANTTEPETRKHYGLHFDECKDYIKVFKCMTTCKSYNYKIYRIKIDCKCFCHNMKTSTLLPFFMWRTNGTTKTLPKTASVKLWHIVGTLSRSPVETTTEVTTVNPCASLLEDFAAAKATANKTGEDGNSTVTGEVGITGEGNGTTATGEDKTVPGKITGSNEVVKAPPSGNGGQASTNTVESSKSNETTITGQNVDKPGAGTNKTSAETVEQSAEQKSLENGNK